MKDLIDREFAVKAAEGIIGAGASYKAFAILAMLNSIQSENQFEIDPDGTLFVSVPKGTKVNRTIVFEDETMFCTTFYPEGEEE